ncbi:hypothetical protein AA23498_1662 [Acetobacter nitrogenifigens DSM 23921 = NBRC 105050]|uniref:4-oxalocrotonate tautomerase-like domain-containing protein n=1 Tax=Acetobacter nitrogenifigens DSM 23921 = NBRC 105050 TaxID=1120919 RepID=A0A511X9B9_9PROT|nr:tautomerase family protein [Acetobacter nitrogenifigens]GBQ93212.1 hypothetical protein AA23498_1662 [Acetobacter nitrogenifigens DSM 23921 = NBRC 105050]GEN59501.1 hypothetical protein ANI02nite_13850 [Acetobacter nitrogenifigens DSM 23921 = NBRC 105050]
MPIIQINLVEGRDDKVVSECVREVARTVSRTLDAPLASVRVMVNVINPQFFSVGDVTKAESAAQKDKS